jgi:hypothetical protein
VTAAQAAENYGAQMYLPKGDEPDVVVLFYRWHTEILNTGEFRTRLEYLTFANLWHGSFDRNQDALVARLVQIPGVPVHDPKASEEAIRAAELHRLGKDEYDRITALRAANKEKEDRREAARR